MILRKLYDYYLQNRNSRDADGQPVFPPYGYETVRASHQLSLTSSGKFVSFNPVDRNVFLPDAKTISDKGRTSSIVPSWYSDNLIYMLGGRRQGKQISFADPKDRAKFDSFIGLHENIFRQTRNKNLGALLAFLKNWKNKSGCYPQALAAIKQTVENDRPESGDHILVRIDDELLHEQPDLIKFWDKEVRSRKSRTIICGITGTEQPPRKIHGLIKGVSGVASAGGKLVSYNKPSHKSYSGRASVGCETEFGYRTVLNHFTRSKSNIVRFGKGDGPDFVFWTEKAKNNFFATVFQKLLVGVGISKKEEENITPVIKNALYAIRTGKYPDELDKLDKGRFYLAVLTGNNGRIFVRNFFDQSMDEIISGISEHSEDTGIIKNQERKYPPLVSLAMATVPSGGKTSPNPNIYQDLLQSILYKKPYPFYIFSLALQNSLKGGLTSPRSPRGLTSPRVALLKGYLCRKFKSEGKEVIPMYLDKNRESIGYQLARMLMHGSWIQAVSIGGIGSARKPNCGLEDKYRIQLSTTPGLVFKTVADNIEYHLQKVRRMAGKSHYGFYVSLDKEYRQILDMVTSYIQKNGMPAVLGVEEQAEFVIGMHMQRYARSDVPSGGQNTIHKLNNSNPNPRKVVFL